MSAAEWIAKERDEFACELSQADGRTIKVELWTYVETDNFVEAERVADGRLRALDALEAVLAFATAERDKISRTYIEQPNTAYAGYANAMDDVIRTIESALRAES